MFNDDAELLCNSIQSSYAPVEFWIPVIFVAHISFNNNCADAGVINKKIITTNTFYLSAYNEIFINAQQPTFDRNRIYGAVGYGINKNLKIELGLMSQILQTTSTKQLQIVLFNNIPFLQKQHN